MTEKRVMKSLPCKMTDEEVRLKGRRLAELVLQRASLQGEQKSVAADFRQRIKDVDESIAEVRDEVDSGEEMRPVTCVETKTSRGTIETVRIDTGETIGSRPLTDEERQEEMPGTSPRPKAGSKKKTKKPKGKTLPKKGK